MNAKKDGIQAVPTNIITGFLGVGKTSAILHLLKLKPSNERWAVLVNEFGEIGVDGSLIESQLDQDQGIFIREVPGGCMCCAAGLPMQVALNQLLTRAKPDRLLIEPTGLGHPKEILQVLCADNYQDVLSLQKTLTLVDARKLLDQRYTTHDTFNQQIGIADIVVGNKLDLYQDDDKSRLTAYVEKHAQPHTNITYCQYGEISVSLLDGPTKANETKPHHHHHHDNTNNPLVSELDIPDCGFIKAANQGEGFNSIGWRFSPTKIFSYHKLFTFLSGIDAERMKAVFITDTGTFAYNLTTDSLTEMPLDDSIESRIEIISKHLDESLETQLMNCLNV